MNFNNKVFFLLFLFVFGGTLLYIFLSRDTNEENSVSQILEETKSTALEVVDDDYNTIFSDGSRVNLSSLETDNTSIQISSNVVTITKGGEYYLTGSNDAQVVVDTKDVVHLFLDNVHLTYTSSSPIYIKNAKKVFITLVDGTTNSLTDGKNYSVNDEGEPDGTLFSDDDLVINGSGLLNIEANYLDGIVSKDSLKIIGSKISITSADDGIRARDALYVENSTIEIQASGDSIKTTNDETDDVGGITIINSTFDLENTLDGIQAATTLYIENSDISIVSGGGSTISSTSHSMWGNWSTNSTNEQSAKGLKSGKSLAIVSGSFTIDSSDDAIHSNNDIAIQSGTYHIESGDDAVHADSSLIIDGGTIAVLTSYEGLEGQNVTINDGEISIVASDDGINSAGGSDTPNTNRPGRNKFQVDENAYILINGGTIYINADGDGIDSNGNVTQNGGKLIINGPENSGNGAIDYEGTYTITGGILVASGMSGMAMMPSEANSTQNSVMINFSSSLQANNVLSIKNSSGDEIVTFKASKSFNNLVISTPNLTSGDYTVYYNGTSSSSSQYGLYETGSYQGDVYTTFTINSTNTTVGQMNQMGQNNGMNSFRETRR